MAHLIKFNCPPKKFLLNKKYKIIYTRRFLTSLSFKQNHQRLIGIKNQTDNTKDIIRNYYAEKPYLRQIAINHGNRQFKIDLATKTILIFFQWLKHLKNESSSCEQLATKIAANITNSAFFTVKKQNTCEKKLKDLFCLLIFVSNDHIHILNGKYAYLFNQFEIASFFKVHNHTDSIITVHSQKRSLSLEINQDDLEKIMNRVSLYLKKHF